MEVVYHDGVKAFLKGLEKPSQSKVLRGIELIERYGTNVGMPHVKKVTNGIYELRVRGQQEVHIFFATYTGRTILLHGFVKKTQKTPKREIETAHQRFLILTTV